MFAIPKLVTINQAINQVKCPTKRVITPRISHKNATNHHKHHLACICNSPFFISFFSSKRVMSFNESKHNENTRF
jgi:hypothetical protein